MAKIWYDNLWRIEFYNKASAKDKVQDLNLNEVKLKVNNACKKDEKLTTNFEPSDDSDVMNKAYLFKKTVRNRWSDL